MVMEQASAFHEKAIPHICSYLPDETLSIEVTVYFVVYIEPGAFARQGKIIMNLAHSTWGNKDVGLLLNILVHELYHGGFHHHQKAVDTDPSMSKEEILEHIMWWLQNEGIATYVSYKAQYLFPIKKDVPDYRMLENMPELMRLSENVNSILTKYEEEPYDKVIEMLWRKGVQERAFYVVGAYMSKKIEEEKGRGALIETIGKGARYFIDTYNDLDLNDFKIIL